MSLFKTARVQIERSKTNQESRKLEDVYFPKIRKIFKLIIKEYGNNLFAIYEAEKKYGPEIKLIIKSFATQAYLLGIDYISKATKEPHLISLSSNDLTQILLQTDEFYRMFWRLITKYIQVLKNRQVTTFKKVAQTYRMNDNITSTDVMLTDEMFGVSDWEDDMLIDEDRTAQFIVSGISATLIGLATLQKYTEYKTEKELIEENKKAIGEGEGFGITFEETELEEKFVFATEMDDRVCPECSQYEGQEFDVDDPSIPVPKLHINCRCRLLLKIGDQIING